MKIYLAGQTSFGNRGCEALVRGTVKIIREVVGPDTVFLVPSTAPEKDRRQWPDHELSGVRFVAVPTLPKTLKLWCSITNRIPGLEGVPPPTPHYSPEVEADLKQCDAVLMIGGDIISLDYGVHSLYFWSKLIERARELKRPTYLWAASVGPFNSIANVERGMRSHLSGYTEISVRESTSQAYLKDVYGLPSRLVGDPAFHLDAIAPRPELGTMPSADQLARSVVINVSPIISSSYATGENSQPLHEVLQSFIAWILETTGKNIVLLYHVDPDEDVGNSDHAYMLRLMGQLKPDPRITLLPKGLNACELKWVIKHCDCLLAGRTHATIAAFSQAVPTVSIGYSRKARALNRDLFGHERYVIDAKKLSRDGLIHAYNTIQDERTAIVSQLDTARVRCREMALESATALKLG